MKPRAARGPRHHRRHQALSGAELGRRTGVRPAAPFQFKFKTFCFAKANAVKRPARRCATPQARQRSQEGPAAARLFPGSVGRRGGGLRGSQAEEARRRGRRRQRQAVPNQEKHFPLRPAVRATLRNRPWEVRGAFLRPGRSWETARQRQPWGGGAERDGAEKGQLGPVRCFLFCALSLTEICKERGPRGEGEEKG